MENTNPFLPENTLFRQPFNKGSVKYGWFISSDKTFSSGVEGFEDFSPIAGMEFSISRFSLFDGTKSSDSAVSAQDVKIYMGSGMHCVFLQVFLSKGKILPSITVIKTIELNGKVQIMEKKEFSECVLQSFSLQGEQVSFSFRYASYSDTYTMFDPDDGTSLGSGAVKVNLVKWEIEAG
jgi:hypothetical protein